MDAREERGRQIASSAQIKRVGRRWAVPSQSRASERYLVDIEESACTCPDFEERRSPCKHQHAVLFWIAWGRDVGADGTVTETLTLKRKTYAQPCWRAYNASQVHERSYVERLLTALCAGIPQPARKPGPGRMPLPIADLDPLQCLTGAKAHFVAVGAIAFGDVPDRFEAPSADPYESVVAYDPDPTIDRDPHSEIRFHRPGAAKASKPGSDAMKSEIRDRLAERLLVVYRR